MMGQVDSRREVLLFQCPDKMICPYSPNGFFCLKVALYIYLNNCNYFLDARILIIVVVYEAL